MYIGNEDIKKGKHAFCCCDFNSKTRVLCISDLMCARYSLAEYLYEFSASDAQFYVDRLNFRFRSHIFHYSRSRIFIFLRGKLKPFS